MEYDVIIVGSGPVGLACSIEARKKGLRQLVLEKGSINDNMRRWPLYMTFFSTAEKVSIGDYPFPTMHARPTREEGLAYYNTLVQELGLPVKTYTPVTHIARKEEGFEVQTPKGSFTSHTVIMATGYYDHPNRLQIPGEDQPHVSHYLDDVFKYAGNRVLVVGGSHSATDAAMSLYRVGAQVTLVHRRPKLSEKLKYWIRPDLENRIKEGKIKAYLNTTLEEIDGYTAVLRNLNTNRESKVPVDFVFLMTGYRPDVQLLEAIGVKMDRDWIPDYHPDTFESNIPGLYLAGSITAGKHVSRIFIENGREHARIVVEHLATQLQTTPVSS